MVTLIPFETLAKGCFTCGPKSQVLLMLASPNMEADFIHFQTFEPQETIEILLILSKIGFFYEKICTALVLRDGSRFLLNPTSNTSPKPHLHKCCHVDIHVILGTWESV